MECEIIFKALMKNNLKKIFTNAVDKGSMVQALTARERLQLVHKLNVGKHLRKQVAPGRWEFDTLAITIKDNEAESLFDIVIEFEKNGKWLPMAVSCFVRYDGTPISIMEVDVTKRPDSEHFAVGLEGEASCFFVENEGQPLDFTQNAASEERRVALAKFDALLKLAAVSQEQFFSRN